MASDKIKPWEISKKNIIYSIGLLFVGNMFRASVTWLFCGSTNLFSYLMNNKTAISTLNKTEFVFFRVEGACDLEILATSKFSGSYFLEEIKGLADACGVNYKVRQSFYNHYSASKFTIFAA